MRIVAGSEIGLHCGNSPEYGISSIGVSGIRFRHLSHVRSIDRLAKYNFYQDIDKQKNPALVGFQNYSHIYKQDDVPVSIYKPNNGIGLYMLAYEKESVAGIWRMLQATYSLSDRQVLVWTGKWEEEDKKWLTESVYDWPLESEWENVYKTGPSWELAHLIRLYKVELLSYRFVPENGLSDCRNHAIDHLRSTNDGRIGWVMFFDPDEQGLTRESLVSLRRMAEFNDTTGWMIQFQNPLRGNHPAAISESIRMVKIDKELNLRMSGRVHESFNKSLNALREIGIEPVVKIAHFQLFNAGLMKKPEEMAVKLELYQRMLLEELKHNPLHSGSWLSLGLQYINDGLVDKAKVCFERACMCADTAFLPYKEMGILLLRESLTFFLRCYDRLKHGHPYYVPCAELIQTISKFSPPIPKVDTGGYAPSKDLELPYFPYDRIEVTERGEFKIIPDNNDENPDTE